MKGLKSSLRTILLCALFACINLHQPSVIVNAHRITGSELQKSHGFTQGLFDSIAQAYTFDERRVEEAKQLKDRKMEKIKEYIKEDLDKDAEE